jgi:hypothetical protein
MLEAVQRRELLTVPQVRSEPVPEDPRMIGRMEETTLGALEKSKKFFSVSFLLLFYDRLREWLYFFSAMIL